MIYLFDPPIPTPTPAPVSLSPEMLRILQDLVKQGASQSQEYLNTTGVLGLIFAVFVGLIALAVLYLWTHRGQSAAADSTLQTIASAFTRSEESREKQDSRIDAIPEAITAAIAKQDEKLQQLGEKHVDGLTAIADAMNRYADNERQTNKLLGAINERDLSHANDIQDIRNNLAAMATKGSPTLQQLSARVEKIDMEGSEPVKKLQASVDMMAASIAEINDRTISYTDVLKTFPKIEQDMRLFMSAIESKLADALAEKRKTGPLAAVTPEAAQ